jgi:hypothetical protein
MREENYDRSTSAERDEALVSSVSEFSNPHKRDCPLR